eukprot:TRINITY_DN6552_c0_g1_i2.p1 TRINITY_DN6552_c0_g1~~TRINITY_DN6552_c0_g1_i2.p1  ORF type:complete len:132 (-),score=36.15 TRINITY_DN6552_c0_g1_i2:45-398(-)
MTTIQEQQAQIETLLKDLTRIKELGNKFFDQLDNSLEDGRTTAEIIESKDQFLQSWKSLQGQFEGNLLSNLPLATSNQTESLEESGRRYMEQTNAFHNDIEKKKKMAAFAFSRLNAN